jgi:hypothetical protein
VSSISFAAGHEPFYNTPFHKVLIHDLFDVLDPYHRVHNPFRIYDNDGAFGAKAETAGGHYFDFFIQLAFYLTGFQILLLTLAELDDVHPVPPQINTCAL